MRASGAPATIQPRSFSNSSEVTGRTQYWERDLGGGISSAWMRCSSRLSSGLPGTMAAPDFPLSGCWPGSADQGRLPAFCGRGDQAAHVQDRHQHFVAGDGGFQIVSGLERRRILAIRQSALVDPAPDAVQLPGGSTDPDPAASPPSLPFEKAGSAQPTPERWKAPRLPP